MKPVSQLITSLSDDEEEEQDEESRWPKLRRLSRDEHQQDSYRDEYQEDEETDYKVKIYIYTCIRFSSLILQT